MDDNTTYEDLLRLSDRIGDVKKKGAPAQMLKHLPKLKFQKTENGETGCPICLVDFEEDETVSALSCLHKFHDVCVKTWLKTNAICPICRVSLQ